MPSDFIREIISEEGAAITETRLILPDSLKKAIAESLERGKRDARKRAEAERTEQPERTPVR